MGAWFEASIIKVSKSAEQKEQKPSEEKQSSILKESTPDSNQSSNQSNQTKDVEMKDVEMKDESQKGESEKGESEKGESEKQKWTCPWEKYAIKDDKFTYHMVWEGWVKIKKNLSIAEWNSEFFLDN